MVLALAERKGNNGSKDHGKEKHNHICMSAQSAKDLICDTDVSVCSWCFFRWTCSDLPFTVIKKK
jgi:hypothetical protein